MPEISIIIPVYNVERYLNECLDSILAQTFQDFEIICIDDGSTDNSTEILKEYQKRDSRFIIMNRKHRGAGASRNLGIKQAKGKYIQFLDADDCFEPDMLEELYTHAVKYNSDMVVCSSRKIDRFGNVVEEDNPLSPVNLSIAPLEKPFNWKDYPDNIFGLFGAVTWNKLYLKELITKNNLEFQNLSSCNDVAFGYVSKIYARRIVIFNKKLINYRLHSSNITANRGDKAVNIIHAGLQIRERLIKEGLYDRLKKSFVQAMRANIRWEIVHCDENQYKKFLSEYRNLLKDDIGLFSQALRKDYITLEYLNKFIGNKKVMLWGASLFIQKVLECESEKNPNILGFIDKNNAFRGKMCGNYKIYPPEAIRKLKPEGVLLTVLSENEDIYEDMQKTFKHDYPEVELLPNIFDREYDMNQKDNKNGK